MALKPRALGSLVRVAAAMAVVATALAGCRGDPPLPPDPEMPTPSTGCDEVPLTLVRVEPDSSLAEPTWVQICTACPVAEAGISVGDGAGEPLNVEELWSPMRECALGLAVDPFPARPSAPVEVALVAADGRAANYSFDLPLPAGRGQDPVDLGSSTWHMPLPDDAFRLLGGSEVLPEPPGGLLISLGAADAEAKRSITIAPTRGSSDVQDLCEPTAIWERSAALLSRQVAAPIQSGDALLSGVLAERGAFQARLTENGDALLDVTMLALVSLPLSEDGYGMPPAAVCALLTDDLGFDPCVPCGPPSDGVAGLPACIPILIEAARAERVPTPLMPVDADSISANCRQNAAGDSAL